MKKITVAVIGLVLTVFGVCIAATIGSLPPLLSLAPEDALLVTHDNAGEKETRIVTVSNMLESLKMQPNWVPPSGVLQLNGKSPTEMDGRLDIILEHRGGITVVSNGTVKNKLIWGIGADTATVLQGTNIDLGVVWNPSGNNYHKIYTVNAHVGSNAPTLWSPRLVMDTNVAWEFGLGSWTWNTNGEATLSGSLTFGGNGAIKIGSSALAAASSTASATAVGLWAGSGTTNAAGLTAIGTSTASPGSWQDGTAIGKNAGYSAPNGYRSVVVGSTAGQMAPFLSESVVIGYGAGKASTNGNAVIIGAAAGATAQQTAYSVLIGRKVDVNRDSTLIIDSRATSAGTNGLIYGEFDTRLLRVNGKLQQWGNDVAIQAPAPTSGGAVVNMAVPWSALATNNHFAVTGFSGLLTGGTNVQSHSMMITNSSGAAKQLTLPASVIYSGDGWITNQAKLDVWVYPGFGTNAVLTKLR